MPVSVICYKPVPTLRTKAYSVQMQTYSGSNIFLLLQM